MQNDRHPVYSFVPKAAFDTLQSSGWNMDRLESLLSALAMPRQLYGSKNIRKKSIAISPRSLERSGLLSSAMRTAGQWVRHQTSDELGEKIGSITDWFYELGLWCSCQISRMSVGFINRSLLLSPSVCLKWKADKRRVSVATNRGLSNGPSPRDTDTGWDRVRSGFGLMAIECAERRALGSFDPSEAARLLQDCMTVLNGARCAESVAAQRLGDRISIKAVSHHAMNFASLSAIESLTSLLQMSLDKHFSWNYESADWAFRSYSSHRVAMMLLDYHPEEGDIDSVVYKYGYKALMEVSAISTEIVSESCESFYEQIRPVDAEDIDDQTSFAAVLPSRGFSASSKSRLWSGAIGVATGAALAASLSSPRRRS